MDEQEPKKELPQEKTLEEKVAAPQTEQQEMHHTDLNFLADSKEALLIRKTPYANTLLYATAGFVVTFLIWANFAKVDEVVKSRCKVISPLPMQIIKSKYDGTIMIENVAVKEGAHVEKNQILATLDNTVFKSEVRDYSAQQLSLEGDVARLTAETENKPILSTLPPGFVQNNPTIANSTINQYNADIQAQNKQVTAQQNILANLQEQLHNKENSVAYGEEYLLNIKRDIESQTAVLNKQKDDFQRNSLAALKDAENKLNDVTNLLTKSEYNLENADIRSPVTGIVNKVYLSAGSTVQPTTPILDIAPHSDNLVFDCQIQPKDNAFIHVAGDPPPGYDSSTPYPGDKAIIMLDTFPFAIYGSLTGHIVRINPGLVTDPQDEKHTYFEAEIDPTSNVISSDGVDHKIVLNTAGMAQILIGKKSVMKYLMKPFNKAHFAMNER